MLDLSKTKARAALLAEDAESDATKLDSTPFTPLGMGQALGTMLAMIAALAKCVTELCDALELEEVNDVAVDAPRDAT